MVQYVEVEGENRPFSFNWNATKWAQAEIKKRGGDFKDAESLENIEIMGFFGFMAGARKEGQKFPYTLDQMGDLLSDDPNLINRITDAFQNDKSVDAKGDAEKNAKRGRPNKSG